MTRNVAESLTNESSARSALKEHPDACGVFLGDPSYVGTTGDLAGHAAAAHDAGVPLLVDQAWAAHLGFHPDLPAHAILAERLEPRRPTRLSYTKVSCVLELRFKLGSGRGELWQFYCGKSATANS